MELKYTVEMEVSEELISNFSNPERNPAGLKIDDLIQTKIETALFPICKGAILVYRAEAGKRPIDLFQKCPVCDHSWGKHFDQIASQVVSMPDGKSLVGKEEGLVTVVKGTLTEPVPTYCSQCQDEAKSCAEALKYK